MAKRKVKETTIDGKKYKYTGSKPMADRIKSAKGKPGAKELADNAKRMMKRNRGMAVRAGAKTAAKTALKRVGPVAAVLTAAEIARGAYKGAKKVGASLKAKKACEGKGSVYRKGFCISSKAIKAKSVKKKGK